MTKQPIDRNSEEFLASLRTTQPTVYEQMLARLPTRPLRPEERDMVVALARASEFHERLVAPDALDAARVKDMLDGGMGSLRFVSAADGGGRCFGQAGSARRFDDSDGVAVTFCLMLDNHGALYELDAWKVNFSPLKRFPGPDELRPE